MKFEQSAAIFCTILICIVIAFLFRNRDDELTPQQLSQEYVAFETEATAFVNDEGTKVSVKHCETIIKHGEDIRHTIDINIKQLDSTLSLLDNKKTQLKKQLEGVPADDVDIKKKISSLIESVGEQEKSATINLAELNSILAKLDKKLDQLRRYKDSLITYGQEGGKK